MLQLFGKLSDLTPELFSNRKKLPLKSLDISIKSELATYSQKMKHDRHVSKGLQIYLPKVQILNFYKASYKEDATVRICGFNKIAKQLC